MFEYSVCIEGKNIDVLKFDYPLSPGMEFFVKDHGELGTEHFRVKNLTNVFCGSTNQETLKDNCVSVCYASVNLEKIAGFSWEEPLEW